MRALKHLSLGLLGLLLAGAIAPAARALPFAAGDLIVTTPGAAMELDPAPCRGTDDPAAAFFRASPERVMITEHAGA